MSASTTSFRAAIAKTKRARPLWVNQALAGSNPEIGAIFIVTSTSNNVAVLQTGFVDEPRRTVEEADKLVAAGMQRLAEGFANEGSGLEKQLVSGDNVSTEDLRVALQRYRSFFDRLLKL